MKRIPKIEIFSDANGCSRWRLRASNGEILATSEAYSSRSKAIQTAKRLRDLILEAERVDMGGPDMVER